MCQKKKIPSNLSTTDFSNLWGSNI